MDFSQEATRRVKTDAVAFNIGKRAPDVKSREGKWTRLGEPLVSFSPADTLPIIGEVDSEDDDAGSWAPGDE